MIIKNVIIDNRTYPVFVLRNTKKKPHIGKYKCFVCGKYHKHGFKSGHRCQHCHHNGSKEFYKHGLVVLTDVAHINNIEQLKNHAELLVYTLSNQENRYAVAYLWFTRHMNLDKYAGRTINKTLFLDMNDDYNNLTQREKSKMYCIQHEVMVSKTNVWLE